MGSRKRIALLIDTATTWGTGLIEGIAEHAKERNEWQLLLGPRGKYDDSILPPDWDGDGIIARVTSFNQANQLIRLGMPVVNVSWYRYCEDIIPRCTCDEREVARMAAEYFLEHGFRQFAYCGSTIRPNYIDRCGEAFCEIIHNAGHQSHCFTPSVTPDSVMPPRAEWDRLIAWLRNLPKPTAILAFDSLQARQVAEACLAGGMQIPHEIAVLGGEYDHLSCSLSEPQLASVDQGPRRVGRAAAELLSQLLDGDLPPQRPILLQPERIVPGQSTDTVAIGDDLLASALRFIKDNCHRRIQVSDILAEVPMSRRALEKGFRNVLGRSPAEEIRRMRVNHAVQLLCDTSWPMPRVASASGFDRPELLTRAFRRELGTTPSDFRRRHRHGVAASREVIDTSGASGPPIDK